MGTITAYDVTDYGAMGDGTTDDSAAIRSCIRDALSTPASEGDPSHCETIYFPPGTYAIFDDRVLSDWGSSVRNYGMKFVGAGMGTTSLKLITAEGARWFWDNEAETPNKRKLMHGVFEDLMFESDQQLSEGGSALASGFKMWSDGHEKQWRFLNCTFRNLSEVLRCNGTGNADQNKFIGCTFWWIKDAVLVLNNTQAVANCFDNCDIVSYGDVIKVEAGGGLVYMTGGSLTLSTDPDDTDREKYLLNIPSGVYGGDDYYFTNLKVETYGRKTGICRMLGAENTLRAATFRDCHFGQVANEVPPEGGAAVKWVRPGVVLGAGRNVSFFNCVIPDQWEYYWDTSAFGSSSPQNCGQILLENCHLREDLHTTLKDRIKKTGYFGRFIVRNCRAEEVSDPSGVGRVMVDQDYNWKNAGRLDVPVHRKFAVLVNGAYAFPTYMNQYESTVVLPENSIILGVHAAKYASGSSTAAYEFMIGNNDKSVIYARSNASGTLKTKDLHEVHVTEIWKEVGTVSNERTVRIWAPTAVASVSHPGYAVVEYI